MTATSLPAAPQPLEDTLPAQYDTPHEMALAMNSVTEAGATPLLYGHARYGP